MPKQPHVVMCGFGADRQSLVRVEWVFDHVISEIGKPQHRAHCAARAPFPREVWIWRSLHPQMQFLPVVVAWLYNIAST